jgi:pilus assembly protein FimV
MPSSKKHTLSALMLALGLAGAQAATLGPISVLSNLGEPLSAEIEIFDLSAEEAGEMDVALASEMEFEKFGASRSALMESLTLRIVQQGRRRLVQLSTDKPLNQPIYGLLLEVRTGEESTLGEFSVLPEEAVKPDEAIAGSAPAPADNDSAATPAASAAAAAEAAADAAAAAEAAADAAAAAGADAASAKAAPVVAESAAEDPAEVAGKGALNLALSDTSSVRQYTVQRGENLTLIARQLSVPDTGLDKFIAALYQENPEAFIQQNLHYLKAGAVLALPSEEAVSQMDEKAARKTIVTQWQTFKSLLPAKDPASVDETANRSSNKKLSAGSAQQAGASGDRLTLAALKPADTGGKTEEEAIAARKAAEEASERIRLLEKNILDLKSSVQPGKPAGDADQEDKASANDPGVWGILSSPARDLMMQAATVLLLAALVVVTLLRRNAK